MIPEEAELSAKYWKRVLKIIVYVKKFNAQSIIGRIAYKKIEGEMANLK